MVESTALEMRHTGNRIGGSNPSLSANALIRHRSPSYADNHTIEAKRARRVGEGEDPLPLGKPSGEAGNTSKD